MMGAAREAVGHNGGGRSERLVEVLGRGLRQLPVLAELAAERTPGRAEREGRGARKEVVEGLLLDRIDMNRHGAAVDQAAQLTAYVDPNATGAALPILEGASARAQQTPDRLRVVRVARLLENVRRGVALQTIPARERCGRPETCPGRGLQEDPAVPAAESSVSRVGGASDLLSFSRPAHTSPPPPRTGRTRAEATSRSRRVIDIGGGVAPPVP